MTDAGLTRQTGNDSVEFVRLDRLADQRDYDFGDICGPMIETSTSLLASEDCSSIGVRSIALTSGR